MSYSRSDATIVFGDTSDLDPAYVSRTLTAVPTDPYNHLHLRLWPTTAGLSVDLASLNSVMEVFVKNLDTANYILAEGRILKSSKTFVTNKLAFVDGGAAADTITDVDNAFVSAQYLRAGDYVAVTGCTDAVGNNTTFGPITAVAAGTITIPTAQVTAEAAEAGLVTMVAHSPFTEKVLAGQWIKLVGLVPGSDLLLTSNTDTCECEVIIIGD